MAAKYVTKIRTADGDKQIDYNALANLPALFTKLYVAQSTPPTETNIFWVDTSSGKSVLKYYDGAEWVATYSY